jgi:hypothetical protein
MFILRDGPCHHRASDTTTPGAVGTHVKDSTSLMTGVEHPYQPSSILTIGIVTPFCHSLNNKDNKVLLGGASARYLPTVLRTTYSSISANHCSASPACWQLQMELAVIAEYTHAEWHVCTCMHAAIQTSQNVLIAVVGHRCLPPAGHFYCTLNTAQQYSHNPA